MYIIFGCEESQACCIEFRKRGHEAYSCDLLPCSGNHPEWHLKMDVFEAIKGGMLVTQSGQLIYIKGWNMGVFFPDCTYLTVSANKWYKDQLPRKSGALVGAERREARGKAFEFFMALWNCGIEKIAIENPIGIMSSYFRKPDQVLQPWMFGHKESKATCLWLNNLPKLTQTNNVKVWMDMEPEHVKQRMHYLPKTPDRAKLRAKTYQGIAKAMAEQWS